MNYVELFNKLEKLAKENDLSVSLETERDGDYAFKIWVYSYKYCAGKHVTVESLKDIESIDFKEIAKVNNVTRTVDDLARLGCSKQDMEERFMEAIYGEHVKKAIAG